MAHENPSIILAAYGTGTNGVETYRSMDHGFTRKFEGHGILWAFTSGYLLKTSRPRIREEVLSLEDAVKRVTEAGIWECVVQSLHVWPAGEYHGIIETLAGAQAPLRISIGAPLIMDHSDFDAILDMLSPDLTHANGEGAVLIAHGTDHSNIALYHAFGKRIRERFGETVWMELVREPESATLLQQRAVSLGLEKVRFVPFMMVAGRHVLKDVMGDHPDSWRSRLLSVGVETRCNAPALGSRPEVFEWFCKRIDDALKRLAASGRGHGSAGNLILPTFHL